MAVPLKMNPWMGVPVVLAAAAVVFAAAQAFRYEFVARRDDGLDRPARHRGVYRYWDFDPSERAWSRVIPDGPPYIIGVDFQVGERENLVDTDPLSLADVARLLEELWEGRA